ncbi:ankyrin repeat-containing domain protein [Trichoderma sp. SZMC 28014]
MSGAEIIGVVAASEQFAEVLFRTIKLAKSVIDQIKDAPGRIQQQTGRLESFASLHQQIQGIQALQTDDIRKILVRCEIHAQSLHNVLQKTLIERNDSIMRKTWKAIFTLKEEENVMNLFISLDQEYAILDTYINLILLKMNGNKESGNDAVEARISTLAQATDSSPETVKCLQALFITDPAMNRNTLITNKGELIHGTCDWIVKKREFVEWKNSNGGLLWISGGPGLGKTMLSIYLTEYLSSCFRSLDDKHYSTYFFCDAKDIKRNNAVAIIRGMLFQLLEQKEELIKHILPTYTIQGEQIFQQSAFETVWKFFVTMIHDLGSSQVTCILDGLDECEPTSLEPLLKKLKNITVTSPSLKIIILSRDYPQHLGSWLGQSPRLRLDFNAKTEVSNGLDQYIFTRVAELSTSKQYPVELTTHIEKTLKEKSSGTYLWVSFIIKDLQTMATSEVEERLKDLPQGLDALYERILESIQSAQRDSTLAILRWCTFATQPLSLNELAAALSIKPTKYLDEAAVLREKLEYCGHFLSITDDTATLVHQSASDFLRRQIPSSGVKPWFSLADTELEQSKLASVCICYFNHVYSKDKDIFQIRYSEKKGAQYPFLEYATNEWVDHFNHSGQQGLKILDEYPSFFCEKSEIWKAWIRIKKYSSWSIYKGYYGSLEQMAIELGLVTLMQRILKKEGIWRNLKNLFAKQGDSPFHLAAKSGHLAIVELFINNKMDINIKAKYGHLLIVEMLLKNNADIHAEDNAHWTPLHYAIYRGRLPTVKILVEKGAHIDGTKQQSYTPLLVAMYFDQYEITEYLLKCALHLACRDGSLPAMHFLLDPKWSLDLNWRDGNGNTTLHVAAAEGKAECVDLLLAQPSVDPKLTNKWGLSPLHMAIACCKEAVARRLMPICNISISLPEIDENCRWNAMHLAVLHEYQGIENSQVNMLRFLIHELGVDPQLRTPVSMNPDDKWHSSHVWEYPHYGDRKAEVIKSNCPQDFCNETPLSLAIRGRFKTVEYFIAGCNIDPNAPCRGCDGARPLHVAAQDLRVDMVQALVFKWKVDVNCLDNRQRTPLHSVASATLSGNYPRSQTIARFRIIQILLKAGASISAKDASGHTPRDLFISNRSFKGAWGIIGRGHMFDQIVSGKMDVGEFSDYN